MTLYLRYNDAEVRVEGYAAFWNTWTVSEHGGRELFRPGAFTSFLERGARGAVANWNHDRANIFASVGDRSLTLWEDRHGLAFQARVAATPLGLGLVGYVSEGNAHCSVQFRKLVCHETDAGIEIAAASVVDICITASPADYQTACWLSASESASLPSHLQDLRRQWHVGREARLATSIARLHQRYGRAAKPLGQAAARRAPPEPEMPFAEYAGPPPAGMSAESWEWFAFMDAAGRRAMRQFDRAKSPGRVS